jgi:membrane protease YdiL (CAAX protease family)
MRRNAARLVAALALIAVAVPFLLRLAQWRFDAYLRDTAAHALALSARAETPWRWRFADAEDIVAGRVFEAGNFDFANGVLTVQSDGRAFEVGLPLPIKPDLRRFPRMDIAASLDAPGRLWVVAAQDIGEAATHTPGIELKPDRNVGPIALTTLPANAAMLRLRVELPHGARLHLRGVALERAAGAVAADLNAPPNVAATIDDKTPDAELAAIAAKSDLRTMPDLLLTPGTNPNSRRGLLERVRAQIPAAILIPADEIESTFAQARAYAGASAREGSTSRIGWIALVAYLAALVASRLLPSRRTDIRAALEAVLVSAAPIWLIAGGHFTGKPDALQICLIAAVSIYALSLGFPRDWRFNGSARAWLLAGAVAVLALCIGLFAHRAGLALRPVSSGHIVRYLAWALIQQYLICAVVTTRWQLAGLPRFVAIWLGAMTFALMHTPNASLMLATFFGGLCWCALYLRERALLPLAFSHAASALVLIALLPPDWLYSAEVSARFFQ